MPTYTLNLDLPEGARAIRLVLDPDDPGQQTVLDHLAAGKLYEPDIAEVLLRALRPGDRFVDVGANVGFFSALAAALVGPAGAVLAFEPVAENGRAFAEMVAANGYTGVELRAEAATDRAGPIRFNLNRDTSGGGAFWDPARFPGNDKSAAAPASVEVTGVRLDEALPVAGFDGCRVLKIDTEGAELAVLRGAEGLLSPERIPLVVAELHEFGLSEMGASQRDLRDHMAARGYATFLLNRQGSLPKLIPPGTRIASRFILNLLFATPEDVGHLWPEERVEYGAPRQAPADA